MVAAARAADLATLLGRSTKSAAVVAVEYVIENEDDRRPTLAYGTVIDGQGTIILPTSAIDQRLSLSQLKDFKVYLQEAGRVRRHLSRRGPLLPAGISCVGWRRGAGAPSSPVTNFAAHGPNPVPVLAEGSGASACVRRRRIFCAPYIWIAFSSSPSSLPQPPA